MISKRPLEGVSQWIFDHQANLVTLYQQGLRKTLFTNRSEMRPTMLGKLAGAEVESLLRFVADPQPRLAEERGAQLSQAGLSTESVLTLGQATRQFCFLQLPEELRLPAFESIENYHNGVVRGYFQAQQSLMLEEQERIRSALQKTLSRYTIQMEVAAEVATAATSILNLDQLLQTTAELIRQRFDLYYVGVFLRDESNNQAVLLAATGEAGQAMVRNRYTLEISEASLIGWAMLYGQTRIALDVGNEATQFENPLLSDTHSEVAIPLLTRGKVIGAMTAQSRRVAAFTDQDAAALRIVADQLANGIENARLYQVLQVTNQELHQASQAKSVFLANMSHELRTPLTAILGYVEILEDEARFMNYDTLIPDLRQIRVAGDHLLTLINGVLDLSKIEAGKMDLFLETFDARLLVDDLAITLRPLVEKSGNTLTISYPENLGTMHADMTKVQQVLLNIVGNAAKFTEKGQITVEASREHGDATLESEDRAQTNQGEEWIIFKVTDTGIGMTTEQIKHIFQPFTQADPSTTRRYGGTGLGLALSHRFCQMMGGDIWVESEINVGSSFTIRLPAYPPPTILGHHFSDAPNEMGSWSSDNGLTSVPPQP